MFVRVLSKINGIVMYPKYGGILSCRKINGIAMDPKYGGILSYLFANVEFLSFIINEFVGTERFRIIKEAGRAATRGRSACDT